MSGEVNLSLGKGGQIPHSTNKRKKGNAKAPSLQHVTPTGFFKTSLSAPLAACGSPGRERLLKYTTTVNELTTSRRLTKKQATVTCASPAHCQKKGEDQGKTSASPSHLRSKRRKTIHSDMGRSPSHSEQLTNQEDNDELSISQLVVSLRYLYLSPITALSILLRPFLDGRMLNTLTTRQKTTPEKSRSLLSEVQHVQRKMTHQGTLHISTSCKEASKSGLHAKCENAMIVDWCETGTRATRQQDVCGLTLP